MERLDSLSSHLNSSSSASNLLHCSNSLEHYKSLSSLSNENEEELNRSIHGNLFGKFFEFIGILGNHSLFQEHYDGMELHRKELRRLGFRQSKELLKAFGIDSSNVDKPFSEMLALEDALISYDPGFLVRNGVHLMLFGESIKALGTEKHLKILKDAYDYKTIGCFGLTELGHGSNARGVLTTAHYDAKTQEFVMNSPNDLAMKFWIGAAKDVADTSVIFAQLYIGEKNYGPHAFVVPLRSKNDHQLLPGVIVGDCGDKNGNVIALVIVK